MDLKGINSLYNCVDGDKFISQMDRSDGPCILEGCLALCMVYDPGIIIDF